MSTAEKDIAKPSSPILEDSSMIQVAQEINRLTRKRHDEKMNKVRQEHAESMKNLRTEIDDTFSQLSERVSKAHTLRVEKLMGLLRKRALVEKEMMASAKKLENALRAANRELQVALEARVQDGDEGEVGDARKHVS